MLKFITDIQNKKEKDILSSCRFKRLMIVSLDGQYLASYDAPKNGWTHDVLVDLADCFPHEWGVCGADALLGDSFVGSTEI